MKIIIALSLCNLVVGAPYGDGKTQKEKREELHAGSATGDEALPSVFSSREFNSAVRDIVTALEGMMSTIESENAEDEALNNKMMCWCDMVNKHVTSSIFESEATIRRLTKAITDLIPQIAETEYLIEKEEKEVIQITVTIGVLTAQIQEAADMQALENKRILKILTAIDHAIAVLRGFHLVGEPAELSNVGEYIKEYPTFLQKGAAELTPEQEARRERLYKSAPFNPNGEEVANTYKRTMGFGGGFVFGVLAKMDSSFEIKLQELNRKWEMQIELWTTRKGQLERKKEALLLSIQANKDHLVALKAAKVEAEALLAAEEAKLIGDQNFLIKARQDCNLSKYEFENTQRFRQEEIAVLVKVIQFLQAKGNWELFDHVSETRGSGKVRGDARPDLAVHGQDELPTPITTFLQVAKETKASALLTTLARKYSKQEYATLAKQAARGSIWTDVYAALAKLKADLVREKAESTDHWTECQSENKANTGRIPKERAAAEADLVQIQNAIKSEQGTLKTGRDIVAGYEEDIAGIKKNIAEITAFRAESKAERAAFRANLTKARTILTYANGVLSAYYNSTTKSAERAAVPNKKGFIDALKQREKTYTPVLNGNGEIDETKNSVLRWNIAPRPTKNRPIYAQDAVNSDGAKIYNLLKTMVDNIDAEILKLDRFDIFDQKSLEDQTEIALGPKGQVRDLEDDIKKQQISNDITARKLAGKRQEEDDKETDIKDLKKEHRYWKRTCPETEADYNAYQALLQGEISDIEAANTTIYTSQQSTKSEVKACKYDTGAKCKSDATEIAIAVRSDTFGSSPQNRCAQEITNGLGKAACQSDYFVIKKGQCYCYSKAKPCVGGGKSAADSFEKGKAEDNEDIYATKDAESNGLGEDFSTMC